MTLVVAQTARAEDKRSAKSGPNRVALVELYTSEGCSSCPPADAWFSTLPHRGLGLDKMIPLALHVDYWNDLGWPDPFSQARFTARQEEMVRRASSRNMYTPEVVLNGRELRDKPSLADKVQALNATPARAELTIDAMPAGDKLRASVRASGAPNVRLYLALYESDLTVAVPRGENGGRTLHHDFVVRELIGPVDGGKLERELALKPEYKRGKLGLAAFVEDATGEVLQALALPL